MRLKVDSPASEVRLEGLQPQTVLGLIVANSVFESLSLQLIVTSVCDGQHATTSKHNSGLAFDCRTNNISDEMNSSLVNTLKSSLGRHFDVVLEGVGTSNEHIHIEWDPKRP